VRKVIWEALCLTVFLGLTSYQLFVPPITGLSDNNDFPKVLGPARVCKAPFDNVNTYFVSGYDAGPRCLWDGGFTSSETGFVNVARWLSRPFTGRYHFDLRASAGVHLLVLAAAMVLFLSITRRQGGLVRWLLPPIAIFMFTDVAYVAYLNSAYMDNAAWVLFLLLGTVAAWGCVRTPAWMAAAYGISGVLLVLSKTPHAALGIPFAALASWFALREHQPAGRAAWSACAAGLLIAAAAMVIRTPPEYRNISLFNLIFYRLAPDDRTLPAQLGMEPEDEKWIGTTAFGSGSPLSDPDWARSFQARVSFADVALLYLRHPDTALRQIDRELHDSVHVLRPDYMANYRAVDGFPPHTVATRFGLWSSWRDEALKQLPYLLPVLYVLPLLAVIRRPLFFPLALTLMISGVCEFLICTLGDGVDTHRHLFLFQAVTDGLAVLTVGAACALTNQGKRRARPDFGTMIL
jgi:hypothetical protein